MCRMATYTFGGREYKFIDVPQEDYICPVCKNLTYDAYQSMCPCARLYCRQCVTQEFVCTTCRVTPKLFPDGNSNRIIRNLRVSCSSDGCPWKGGVGQHDEHLQKCGYLLIPCGNGCGMLVPRGQLELHLAERCTLRLHMCPHCTVVDKYQTITGDHLETCPDLVCPCPNQECTETFKRRDAAQHRATCLKEMVECAYSKSGCTFKSQRESLRDHHHKFVHGHLALLNDKVDILQAQLEEYKASPLQMSRTVVKNSLLGGSKVADAIVLKFLSFQEHKEGDKEWRSPGFYTHERGYVICLSVYANGSEDGRGTHVSVYVTLMKGKYDDELAWPMCRTFRITMLNQARDENHRVGTICLDGTTGWNRMSGDEQQSGYSKFVRHLDLLDPMRSDNETQYLVNDTLFFRVEAAIEKPWLAAVN